MFAPGMHFAVAPALACRIFHSSLSVPNQNRSSVPSGRATTAGGDPTWPELSGVVCGIVPRSDISYRYPVVPSQKMWALPFASTTALGPERTVPAGSIGLVVPVVCERHPVEVPVEALPEDVPFALAADQDGRR